MGKKLRDEDLVLNVIINGDKAKKELGDLEQSTRDLKSTNKDLRAEKEKLKRAGKEESARYKEITAEIKQNNKTIKTNEARMKELRSEMGMAGMTTTQLRKEARRLQSLLDNSTYGTDNWRKYRAELDKVQAQMGIVKAKGKGLKATLGKIADGFNRFSVMGASVIATLTGIIFSIKEWVGGMVSLSDELSDIMKTTGLTKKEVRELNGEFKNLNTRTSRKELRGLAEEAGRLGKKSKQDVMDFVEVANQINVALGDDLGDAQKAVKEVGKLTNIYKVGAQYGTNFKDSMSKIGSGINEVSANSSAQADYLIGYLKRMGGVATQADVNASQILGYASALDQLGQTQEMAATAQGKVMIDMFTDHAKYAEIAKMSTEDFYTLLKTDANEAFLKVLEGLNGNNEGLTVMAGKLDELGVDGARAVQVLSTLASNTELVRKEQDIANDAMDKGVSLLNEYKTKNENFAGSVAKISQFIHSKLINSSFLGWIEKVVGKMAEWTKVDVSKTLKEQQKHVNLLTIEMTSSNTSGERRNEIYKELQGIAPEVVANIDKENISVSTLRKNLEQYNMAMIKKLALHDSEQALEKEREKAGKATQERIEKELELETELFSIQQQVQSKLSNWKGNENLAEQIQEINLSSEDVITKQKRVTELLGDQRKFIRSNAEGLVSGIVSSREAEKEATDDVTKAMEDYMKQYNKVFNIQGGTTTTTHKISTIQMNEFIDDGSDDKEFEAQMEKEIMATITAEEKLSAAILSIRKQLGLSKKTEAEKEISEVEEKYRKLIDTAKANGIDTTELENLKQQELTTLAKKHEDERQAAKEAALQKLQEATMSTDEKEKQDKIKQYQDLLVMAEQFGFDTTEMYRQLKAELDFIMNGGEEGEEEEATSGKFFGMSLEDMDAFIEKMGEVIEYASALRDGLGSVFQIADNADQKKFNKEKKRANDRKKLLKSQLDSNKISQETYNKEVAKIDDELEKKQEELDKKKARREKVMGVLNVGINTATGIMKAVAASPLTGGMPWTAIVAAIGALQMGAVLSAPGLESGGYTDVVRAQDGKPYRAQIRRKRGFVDKPSVLVGEEKPEFVASGEAVENPTVKPFLDIIDYHQRAGDIHSLDLNSVFSTMPSMRGYESGGYTKTEADTAETADIIDISQNNEYSQADLINAIRQLNTILSRPILAELSLFDLQDRLNEMDKIKTRS